MSDSSPKNTSGLSDMAHRALDAILNRGKDDQDEEKGKDNSSSSVGRRESSGGGSASDILSAGTQSAARSANQPEANMGGGSHYDTSRGSGVVEEEEFVGSGGVGSAEFMEAIRKGHEAAGDEYTSDLSNPNKPDDGPGKV